jgi:phosphotriesterase-related protein
MMSVMSVTGEISAKDIGTTSIHEHILCNFIKNHEPLPGREGKALTGQQVSVENLGVITQNPLAIKDNLVLSDENAAKSELAFFKKAGGRTIVDLTTVELGRDPVALKNIARSLDINIVTCTGHYIHSFKDSRVRHLSIEEIVDHMMKEITSGIDNTGIRAGIMGELGTSEKIYPDEEKVLLAAANVNRTTGVPIMVHTDPQNRIATEAVRILLNKEVNPQKISICHMDSNFFEETYYREVLSKGVYIEFDTFGEHFCLHPNYGPSDLDRIKTLRKLINEGFVDHIMLGNDVCLKCRLRRYGGWGYDHLLTNVVPAMKRWGITDKQINTMLVENPRRYLDVSRC